MRCNEGALQGKILSFIRQVSKIHECFLQNLLLPTFIALVCDVVFKIKYLLFTVFSMFGLVQWQGVDIFLFFKVHMILDFFLIIINDYEIHL